MVVVLVVDVVHGRHAERGKAARRCRQWVETRKKVAGAAGCSSKKGMQCSRRCAHSRGAGWYDGGDATYGMW